MFSLADGNVAFSSLQTELASQSVPEEVGGSGGAPLISSSATKHKKPPAVGNQKMHMVVKRAETSQKKQSAQK